MSTTVTYQPSRQVYTVVLTLEAEVASVRFDTPDYPVVQYNIHKQDCLLWAKYRDEHYPIVGDALYRRIQITADTRKRISTALMLYRIGDVDQGDILMRLNSHIAQWVKEGGL